MTQMAEVPDPGVKDGEEEERSQRKPKEASVSLT